MSVEFNPYLQWLGIPATELPLDFYRLLGLPRFEADVVRIEQAARAQTEKVQPHASGPAAGVAERVLKEIEAARGCLTAADKKSQYDAKLKAKLAGTAAPNSAVRKAMPVAKPLSKPPAPTLANPAPVQATSASNRTAQPKARSNSLMPIVLAAVTGIAVAALGAMFYFTLGGPSKSPAVTQTKKDNTLPAEPASDPVSDDLTSSPVKPPPAITPQTTPAQPAALPIEPSTTTPEIKPVEVPAPPAPRVDVPAPAAPPTESVAPPPPIPLDPPASPPADQRLPIPSEAQLVQAEKEIREAFADVLAAAKKPEERLALAQDLTKQGDDSNNSPAVRYAAWQLARSLTKEAGDLDGALDLIESVGKVFAISTVTEKVAVLNVAAEDSGLRAKALAAARREFDALLQTEAYAEATEMGRAALQIAKFAKDKSAVDQITAAAVELKSRQQAQQEYLAAAKRLQENDGDAAANLTVGRWLWFVKGDLPNGLLHLSLGSDAKLAAAAAADLAEPTEVKQQMAVFDQWRGLAENETGGARAEFLKRVQYWGQKAIPAAVGLDKLRLEKQLAEAGKELPASSPVQTAATDSPAANPGKRAPPPPTPNERPPAEWKVPKANANTAFRCFLGLYMYQEDRTKVYPVANLRVPNGTLWTKEVQDKCRGRISFDEISWQGSASFAVPADGVYILSMKDGNASINGKPTGGQGQLNMVRGIHTFMYSVGSHGQPHINFAAVSMRHKETGEEVIFFNTWRDIQTFLATPVAGQRVLEVSDWKPTAADEVRVDSKTLKVTNPN